MLKKFFTAVLSAAVLFCNALAAEEINIPKMGDEIASCDYSDLNNWLAIPAKTKKKTDVFFVYPTAWRADGKYPVADINNEEMRGWAKYYLDFRSSAFETEGNIFAPYYRQLDALFAFTKLKEGGIKEALSYFGGVPATDILAAFDYYIKNLNGGRPFILAGHSQGSAMILFILMKYMKENPDVYKRMVAAYVIGVPITKQIYGQNPHLKPAQNASDTGVIISYNTQSPQVDGINPMSAGSDAVLINPLTWTTGEALAGKSENLGSLYVDETGKAFKKKHIADAKIDGDKGVIICSTVDSGVWSSAAESRSYFPLGVFHENDIPLYYYNLRQNAKIRIKEYFKK
jgi:hypothetical protein